jgi:hypothetical protein
MVIIIYYTSPLRIKGWPSNRASIVLIDVGFSLPRKQRLLIGRTIHLDRLRFNPILKLFNKLLRRGLLTLILLKRSLVRLILFVLAIVSRLILHYPIHVRVPPFALIFHQFICFYPVDELLHGEDAIFILVLKCTQGRFISWRKS